MTTENDNREAALSEYRDDNPYEAISDEDFFAGWNAALSSRPSPATDEAMTCVHCGMELGKAIHDGLYTHANNLQRCQADVPYGHMGHPTMPCPSGTVNDCLGSREEVCDHLASRPSSLAVGDGGQSPATPPPVLHQSVRPGEVLGTVRLATPATDDHAALINKARALTIQETRNYPVDTIRIIDRLVAALEGQGQK